MDKRSVSKLIAKRARVPTKRLSLNTAERQLMAPKQQFYDSTTKLVHRYRILTDMFNYQNATKSPASLLFLSAPNSADSESFQTAIDLGQLHSKTRLVAVNNGDVSTARNMSNVEIHSQTHIERVVKNSSNDSFSHVWLDLTEHEPDPQMLWDIARVLKDSKKRDSLYLSLSTRHRTFEVQSLIIKTMAKAAGFKTTHCENYTGGGSTKKNMSFFVCEALVDSNDTFDPRHFKAGGIAWVNSVPANKKHRMETLRHRNGTTPVFIRHYKRSSDTYACSLIDTTANVLLHKEAEVIINRKDMKEFSEHRSKWLVHCPAS
jgi:hypothetical protein